MNAVVDSKLVVTTHPEIMGGTPVFAGTRVPVQTLFAYLEAGDNLEEFFEDFPSVSPEQAHQVLELSKDSFLDQFCITCG